MAYLCNWLYQECYYGTVDGERKQEKKSLGSQYIYGFNGKHLGWFIKGLVYDHDGDAVGAVTSRFKTPQPVCPIESIQKIKSVKTVQRLPPLKPLFHSSWADDVTLKRFLLAGKHND